MSLYQQYRQFIDDFIQDLRKDNVDMFTNDFIMTLQQLDNPLKPYKSDVFLSAKIKMDLVLEKAIKDVL